MRGDQGGRCDQTHGLNAQRENTKGMKDGEKEQEACGSLANTTISPCVKV
jgi:hypothetical protein